MCLRTCLRTCKQTSRIFGLLFSVRQVMISMTVTSFATISLSSSRSARVIMIELSQVGAISSSGQKRNCLLYFSFAKNNFYYFSPPPGIVSPSHGISFTPLQEGLVMKRATAGGKVEESAVRVPANSPIVIDVRLLSLNGVA